MSSGKKYSAEESSRDGSMPENQDKKVCFICGSHTTLVVNIHEPRSGPNMIEVISEKFQMRPLNDDKFLCYNCNNWLVNWYTTQKTYNDGSHEDPQQTTSSTMSTAITTNVHEQTAPKTSDDRLHISANKLVIMSDNEDDENVDVNNVIQTLRNRLKKYLYYPNKQKDNDLCGWQAHPHTTVIELNRSAEMHRNCERCGKMIRKQSNRLRQRTFCRNCRFAMRRTSAQLKSNALHSTRSENRHNTRITSVMGDQSETPKLNNRINIFEKLQQLGTSIYYENECKGNQTDQSQHMTSIHEINTSTYKRPMHTWNRSTTESNEILMTFNTVVTEVFPIEQLNNYQIDQMHTTDENVLNIQEILRNVPKSLTITCQ